MKIQSLLSVALLTLSLQTAFARTSCSSADTQLQYTAWGHEGGAHPGKGMVIARQKWSYQGKVIGQKEVQYLVSPTPEMDLQVKWQTKTVLLHQASPMSSLDIYAGRVVFSRKSGEAVLPGMQQKTFTQYLICTEHHAFMVP
jgi:hypothetical protein